MNDMTNEIKVSIIMPVYNSGKYLRPAVDSILTQSMKEFELILVDDGSSDGSEKVCDEYAQAHPEGTFPIVRVIHQKNGGICKARNVAFSEARGEYIGFCDHDDIYLPGLIETAYTKAKQYDADVVKWGVGVIEKRRGKTRQIKGVKYEEKFFKHEDLRKDFAKLLVGGFFNFIWDGIYKRSYVNERGLRFDESFKRGREDITFMLTLFAYSPIVVTLPQVLYTHYVRAGFSTSATHIKSSNQDQDADICALKQQKLIATAISKLDIDLDYIKEDYMKYVASFIHTILSHTAWPEKKFTRKDFYPIIASLRNIPDLPPYLQEGDVSSIYRYHKKTGIMYFLFKYKLDFLLYAMYWILRRSRKED